MSWDVGSWVIDTVNSVLGTLINTHGTQTFTSNGTFTVPDGVTKILVTAFGAGGSGHDFDGGQGGDFVVKKAFTVNPGNSISITVGKGNLNNDGGATVIGNLITLAGGGKGGNARSHRGALGGTSISGVEVAAQNTVFAYGGLKGITYRFSDNTYIGGYGGGAGYGRGGYGGEGTDNSSTGGSGGKGDIGAGGGGGGDGTRHIGTPGSGGDGIVIIEW